MQVDYPVVWNHDEFSRSFAKFLDHIRLDQVREQGKMSRSGGQPPSISSNSLVCLLFVFLPSSSSSSLSLSPYSSKVHIFGASLGAFLAQKFAEHTYHCQRVQSLIICNGFTGKQREWARDGKHTDVCPNLQTLPSSRTCRLQL